MTLAVAEALSPKKANQTDILPAISPTWWSLFGENSYWKQQINNNSLTKCIGGDIRPWFLSSLPMCVLDMSQLYMGYIYISSTVDISLWCIFCLQSMSWYTARVNLQDAHRSIIWLLVNLPSSSLSWETATGESKLYSALFPQTTYSENDKKNTKRHIHF